MDWLVRLLGKAPRARLDMAPFAPVPEGGVLVGGALRDALAGRGFADLDWLVENPEQAARRAADALDGSAFSMDEERGHWRVVAGGAARDYIRLEGSLDDNLRERDFTVNAIAAGADGRLTDPLGGLQDLRRSVLRMVAVENLKSDPLRALRGARLAVQLGLEIEAETHGALAETGRLQRAGNLPLPAWERTGDELDKLLALTGAARGVRLLHELGLLEVYLPELERGAGVSQGGYHHLDVLAHQIDALARLEAGFPDADLALRWATLLHDVGKPDTREEGEARRAVHFYGHNALGAKMAAEVMARLRRPVERRRKVEGLVHYHMLPLPSNRREARRFVHRRRELLPDLLKLMIADREASRGPLSSEASRQAYRMALARVLEIMTEPAPAKPILDGREIMALLGMGPGPRVGEAVRFVAEAEAVGDVSTKEEAAAALRDYARGQGWTEGGG